MNTQIQIVNIISHPSSFEEEEGLTGGMRKKRWTMGGFHVDVW